MPKTVTRVGLGRHISALPQTDGLKNYFKVRLFLPPSSRRRHSPD